MPVYNEEKWLHHLDEVFAFSSMFLFVRRLVVVNDGSRDRTLEESKKWQTRPELKIISYNRNRGKGYADKQGMMRAKGRYRLFMEIDLSTPLTQRWILKASSCARWLTRSRFGSMIGGAPTKRQRRGRGLILISE
ncbi:MAG: glycosyltransferase [Candidatus Aminicenantales bacterium]